MKTLLALFLALNFCSLHSINCELKFGGFVPASFRMREIYGSVLPIYGAEIDVPLWKKLHAFGAVDTLSNKGRSIHIHSPTHLNLTGLGFGLEYLFPLSPCIQAYAGLGPKVYWLLTRDNNLGVPYRTSKSGWGAIAKAGALWRHRHFYLDAFFEYSYCQITPKATPCLLRYSVDVGGLTFGAGAGFIF